MHYQYGTTAWKIEDVEKRLAQQTQEKTAREYGKKSVGRKKKQVRNPQKQPKGRKVSASAIDTDVSGRARQKTHAERPEMYDSQPAVYDAVYAARNWSAADTSLRRPDSTGQPEPARTPVRQTVRQSGIQDPIGCAPAGRNQASQTPAAKTVQTPAAKVSQDTRCYVGAAASKQLSDTKFWTSEDLKQIRGASKGTAVNRQPVRGDANSEQAQRMQKTQQVVKTQQAQKTQQVQKGHAKAARSDKAQGKKQPVKSAAAVRRDLMTLGRRLLIVLAALATAGICIWMLSVKSGITAQQESISNLRQQVSEMKDENDARFNHINESVNLEHVRLRAVDLGMEYAQEEQVILYEPYAPDYVEQKNEIPK